MATTLLAFRRELVRSSSSIAICLTNFPDPRRPVGICIERDREKLGPVWPARNSTKSRKPGAGVVWLGRVTPLRGCYSPSPLTAAWEDF